MQRLSLVIALGMFGCGDTDGKGGGSADDAGAFVTTGDCASLATGTYSDADIAAPAAGEDVKAFLAGSWGEADDECHSERLIVTGDTIVRETLTYNTVPRQCGTPSAVFRSFSSDIAPASPSGSGLGTIDMKFTGSTWTLCSASVAKEWSEKKICDVAEWTPGVAVPVPGCVDPMPAAGDAIFSQYKIEDGGLKIGLFFAVDSTAADREDIANGVSYRRYQ